MFTSWPSAALVDGVNIGSGEPVGQLQPRRQGRAVHGAVRLVLLQGRAGQIPPDDALEGEHLGPAHEHGPPGDVPEGGRARDPLGDLGRVGG